MTAKNNVKELCFDKDKILSVWCILLYYSPLPLDPLEAGV